MKRARLRQVRLTEVPLKARIAAARAECEMAADDDERAKLLFAAMFPSDTPYWVRVDEPFSAAA